MIPRWRHWRSSVKTQSRTLPPGACPPIARSTRSGREGRGQERLLRLALDPVGCRGPAEGLKVLDCAPAPSRAHRRLPPAPSRHPLSIGRQGRPGPRGTARLGRSAHHRARSPADRPRTASRASNTATRSIRPKPPSGSTPTSSALTSFWPSPISRRAVQRGQGQSQHLHSNGPRAARAYLSSAPWSLARRERALGRSEKHRHARQSGRLEAAESFAAADNDYRHALAMVIQP